MAKREYSCCRSWLILIVIGVSSPGTYSFHWNSKPKYITAAELGKKVVIQWSYQMKSEEQFESSYIMEQDTVTKKIKTKIAQRKTQGNYTLYRKYENMDVSGNSAVSFTIKNVTDKMNMSEEYCCTVDTNITREIHCTRLFIYVRPKIINITPHISATQGSVENMKCNASGDPVPNFFWTKKTDMNHERLANTSKFTLNITGKESTGKYCCVAKNTYGNDTACMFVYLTAVPVLLNTTPANYTMTNTSVKIACEAKGNPTPKILWINKSNKTINQSTDGNYTVSFQECSNETLTYYCIGSNSEGDTTRKRITVHVNTYTLLCNKKSNDTPGREIQEINTWMPVLIVTVCCALLVILTTVLSLECSNRRKRKKSLNMEAVSQVPEEYDRQPVPLQSIEESPYGEPIDAIKPLPKPGCQGDYATIQDIRVNRNKRRTTSSSDDDNLYASVINSNSPKKNKNKQSTEIPLMTLYEEIPGQKNSA